jgi:hypothetical protein
MWVDHAGDRVLLVRQMLPALSGVSFTVAPGRVPMSLP